MKKFLFILLSTFVFSCGTETPKEHAVENNDTIKTDVPQSSAQEDSLYTADTTLSLSSDKSILGTIIIEYGENCELAIQRTNNKAEAFMRSHSKPCYKAATVCTYDSTKKVYWARANVHNHQGSCR